MLIFKRASWRRDNFMSVLSIDSSNTFELQTQTLVGRSIAVLGITGSGKTNTAAVLIEELLSNGLPLTIVDIEGEYWGLKERFEILVAGRSEHSELKIGPEHAEKLAEVSLKRSISVILDLSDFTPEESNKLLLAYFKSLWTTSSIVKKPYQIVLEEAHEFVPQNVSTPLKQALIRIALRGRKRGLGIIMMSQRSAKVEKDMLTQASLLFLHKVVHPIDLKVYKDLIPLPAAQVEAMVRKLQPGEAIVVYNHEANIVQLRLRYTFHGGSTPLWNHTSQPKLRKLDTGLLKELRSLTAETAHETTYESEQAKLAKKVEGLEQLVALKDAEIQRLQGQVDLLSKLSISVEGLSTVSSLSDTYTLNVDKAVVRHMITGESQAGTNPGTTSTTIVHLPESNNIGKERPLTLAEQRKLDSLIQRLHKLPKLQLSILRLLAEHEGSAMTVPIIATWLSLKESTIRNHPPHDLMRMKLITRMRSGRSYRYVSSVSAYLRVEFPQVDLNFLLLQII
jgi:Helicase HerA, central domain